VPPGGVLVRVDVHVDGRALRRVLGALSGTKIQNASRKEVAHED
jgi:hypothetical protein